MNSYMNAPVDDRTVLVTGASSGFGALMVRALADAGHTVYAGMRNIGDRNRQAAADAVGYAEQNGVVLRPVEMDVVDQDSVDRAVTTVLDEARGIDVLVHNAGHMVLGPTEAFTPEQLARLTTATCCRRSG
jgi:NADP-dependent 3-hydroxy acid dehydrogenase YdfG